MRLALRDDFPRAVAEFRIPAAFARTLETMDAAQTEDFCKSMHGAPLFLLNEAALIPQMTLLVMGEELPPANTVAPWESNLVAVQVGLLMHITQSLRDEKFTALEHWGISERFAALVEELDAAQLVMLVRSFGGRSVVTARTTLSIQVGLDLAVSGLSGLAVGNVVALNQLCTRPQVMA